MSVCSYCKGLQILFRVKNNLMRAEVCRYCAKTCKKCDKTGVLFYRNEKNQWFSKPCKCSIMGRKSELLNMLELPGKYFDAEFNNFQMIGDIPKLKSAIDKSRAFVNNVSQLYNNHNENDRGNETNLPRGLLFYGTPGTGKTRMMSVILKELILKSHVQAKFIEFSTLISEIKKGYDSGESEKNLILPLIDTDILGIDELAKGRKSDWWIGIIDEIITGRYNAGKITLFTTNYNPGRITLRDGNSSSEDDIYAHNLKERLNGRIYSRLLEMCDFVDMNFTDYREKTGTFAHSESETVKVI